VTQTCFLKSAYSNNNGRTEQEEFQEKVMQAIRTIDRRTEDYATKGIANDNERVLEQRSTKKLKLERH